MTTPRKKAPAKKAAAPADPTTTAEEVSPVGEIVSGISQWEFLDRAPHTDEVLALLDSLPRIYGASLLEVADYVSALPQKKKVKRAHPNRPGVLFDANITSYTLYVGVAGRLVLVQRIAEQAGWTVEFVPEPVTPTGIPGFLVLDERIVYREYMRVTDSEGRLLGSKPGTAWVPARDGRNAAGTNPWEKVETAARGRAIAAWGIGVLPGSGVASLEEIQAANAAAQNLGGAPAETAPRRSRDQLLADVQAVSESLRQMRDKSVEEWNDLLASRLSEIGVRFPEGRESGDTIDWSLLSPGHLQMLSNDFNQTRDRLVGTASDAGTPNA